MEDKKSIWTEAGKAGLILGAASTAYLLLTWGISSLQPNPAKPGILFRLLSIALWAIKFSGCIYLMKFLMKKYAEDSGSMEQRELQRFGIATAFLSALVYSAAYLAYSIFLAPDLIETAIDTLRESPMMDSNSLQALEAMIPKLPTITFVTNLIYCTLFGTVLSSIFSRSIISSNPFKDGGQNNN